MEFLEEKSIMFSKNKVSRPLKERSTYQLEPSMQNVNEGSCSVEQELL